MSKQQILGTPLDGPIEMQSLTEPERCLIRSFRHWVVGWRTAHQTHWCCAWRDQMNLLGEPGARSVICGLQEVVAAIGNFPRRQLRLHPPCCGFVCLDELSIVALVAACQRRDFPLARANAEWLVVAEGMAGVLAGANRIGAALREGEISFPDRSNRNHRGAVRRRLKQAAISARSSR